MEGGDVGDDVVARFGDWERTGEVVDDAFPLADGPFLTHAGWFGIVGGVAVPVVAEFSDVLVDTLLG